jgi:hypothetical protein
MSRTKDAYIEWANRQFEETGIAPGDFSPSGGGIANSRLEKHKRDTTTLTPESIEAFKNIAEWEHDNHFNIVTEKDIKHEAKINQYIKDCETIGNEAAKQKYLGL